MEWVSANAPTLAALVFLACALNGVWLVWRASRGRLLRCPESGCVAFVEVRADAVPAKVIDCELWPQRSGCGQHCLSRWHETAAGRRIDLKALRPF